MLKTGFIFFLLLVSAFVSFSNELEPIERKITLTTLLNKSGLTQDYITCTIQDDLGFIWVGTPYGLFKYDGNSFSSVPVNEMSSNISIQSFFKDNSGDIWISTLSGLFIYRAAKRVIEVPFENQPWEVIMTMHQQNDSIFWFGCINGELIKYNRKENKYNKFNFSKKYDLNIILPIDENTFLLGFDGGSGCIHFNINTHQTEYSYLDSVLSDASLQLALNTSSKQNIIVCDKGLLYLKHSEQAKWLGDDNISGIKTPQKITSLIELNDSILWLGTDGNGLYEYNFKTDRFTKIKTQESLLVLAITSLHLSREGLVWVGTTNSGVLLYEPQKTRFKHWGYEKGKNSGLSYNSVLCLTELKNGNILIGLDGGGGNLLETKENNIIHLDINRVGARIESSIIQDHKGYIWIGTYDRGLKYFKIDSKNNLKEQKLPFDFPGNSYVKCMMEDCQNNIWIGSSYGVFLYNRTQNRVLNLNELAEDSKLPHELTTMLYEDEDSNIWIGTSYGLYKYCMLNYKLEKVELSSGPTSNLYITDIMETSNKELLVGTKSGLWKIDKIKKDTVCFTMKDGLPNDRVNGILQDEFKNIWITTDQGISLCNNELSQIRNFGLADGIQGKFNENVAIKTSEGVLYFGGSNGIYACNQNEVYTNTHMPPVVINALKIHDSKEVDLVRPLNIHDKKEVKLTYRQNVFTIDFIALNYTLPQKNTYAYKLEDYDKSWINKTNVHSVTYTNIPPGNYLFKVKAANNDGVWNETGSMLRIVIRPPWYKSTLAFILWVILLLAIVLLINWYILVQLRLKDALKAEKEDKLKQIEINRNKLQFFTNITHELRAPLSLIMGPVDNLLKNEEPYTKKYEQLKLLSKHSNRLFKLINQILEFRKVEHSAKQVTVSRQDIVSIVKEICESYQDLAKEKYINLSFHCRFERLIMWIDVSMLEIIIHNLISNAVKYTPSHGAIDLGIKVKAKQQSLEILVKDNGVGIAPKDINHIFDRFYQADNKMETKSGTGIGLALTKSLVNMLKGTINVESTPQIGSKFTVLLKLGRAHFSSKDIIPGGSLVNNNSDAMVNDVVQHAETPLKGTYSEKDKKQYSVLIVEDEDDLRQYIAFELKQTFKVYTASDGVDGYSKILEFSPSLIVSDIQMPQMSGLELCEKIKNNFETSHIPVILLTALEEENVHKKGLEIGVDDYLIKPFNIALLSIKIKNILETRQKLIERFKTEEVIKLSEAGITMADEEFLNKVIETINAHISEQNFKVDQLIAELGMSRSLFFKKIKSITGTAPAEFIRSVKLKYAAKLLVGSSMTISEIAFEVGFTSLKHFRERFKIQYGLTPSLYAKEKKNAIEVKMDTVSQGG